MANGIVKLKCLPCGHIHERRRSLRLGTVIRLRCSECSKREFSTDDFTLTGRRYVRQWERGKARPHWVVKKTMDGGIGVVEGYE